jgi:hypothetical protein
VASARNTQAKLPCQTRHAGSSKTNRSSAGVSLRNPSPYAYDPLLQTYDGHTLCAEFCQFTHEACEQAAFAPDLSLSMTGYATSRPSTTWATTSQLLKRDECRERTGTTNRQSICCPPRTRFGFWQPLQRLRTLSLQHQTLEQRGKICTFDLKFPSCFCSGVPGPKLVVWPTSSCRCHVPCSTAGMVNRHEPHHDLECTLWFSPGCQPVVTGTSWLRAGCLCGSRCTRCQWAHWDADTHRVSRKFRP